MPMCLRKILATLLLGVCWSPISQADDITIAVASNFTTAAKTLAKNFEQTTDHKVQLAFGSTGAQYAQIKHGAPFDAFFAADVKTPALLESEKKIIPGSRFTYAQGKLVLWSPKTGLIDHEGKILKQGTFKHLAIANPKLAPYGFAAQQTLEALGLFNALEAQLVRGENIGQTYQFIYSGAAVLGFVAFSQILDAKKSEAISGSYWLVPQALYDPLEQQAVLLTDKKAAREFMEFVKSDKGKKIIRAHGYSDTAAQD